MAKAEALKGHDGNAAMQDLMVRIARAVAEANHGLTNPKAEKLSELQADRLVKAIAKVMGHRHDSVRRARGRESP